MAYTDIDLNLNKQKDADIQTLADLDAIKANLMNIAKTMQGSRRMQPTFCFGPTNFLAEQMTQQKSIDIGNALVESINQYEDRITITNINTQGNLQTGSYNVTLSYKVNAFGPADTIYKLNFILKRI
jgi:phage baseplate assembly protein W